MKLLKHFRVLKASSILESVIAITIISICVLVAFLVYLNIISQNKPISYYDAKHKVEFITNESLMNKNYDNETFKFKNYNIIKTVTIDKEAQTAFIVFKVKTGNKTHEINKLIPYYE